MITEVKHTELNQYPVGKNFWGMASAIEEQSRRKANMAARGDEKFGPQG